MLAYNYGGAYDQYGGYCTSSLSYNTFSQQYWERSLFQRCKALFDFTGLPEGAPGQVQWDNDAFLWGLFKLGFMTVFDTKTYGLVVQPGTPTGYGLQYQPTGIQVQTPYFAFTRPLLIGRECELIKLTPDYTGIWDIITKYAEELKFNDVAIRLSQINARFAYAVAATDEKSARTIKAILQRLANGEEGVVYDAKLNRNFGQDNESAPWMQFDRDLKKNFIYPDLLEARRTILTDFYRELGVQSASDKRERQNLPETMAFQAETFNRRQVWELSLRKSIDRVNRMFGTKIDFKFNEPSGLEGGEADANKSADSNDRAT